MAIINIFTYNGEANILELHLDMMYAYVDQFIIVEGHETFNGWEKPLYYKQQEERFTQWSDKIQFFEITKEMDYPNDPELLKIADASPNVPLGVEHWRREFYKKELLMNAMKGLDDDDTVIIGDVDEVLDPSAYIDFTSDEVLKYKMYVYVYYLNNLSDEEFYGPIVAKYKNIKNGILNHLRQFEHIKVDEYKGWHFTNMGGKEEIIRKVQSSYDEWEHLQYTTLLTARMMTNVDYIGRDYIFITNESRWPEYLKKHKDKYLHLIK